MPTDWNAHYLEIFNKRHESDWDMLYCVKSTINEALSMGITRAQIIKLMDELGAK